MVSIGPKIHSICFSKSKMFPRSDWKLSHKSDINLKLLLVTSRMGSGACGGQWNRLWGKCNMKAAWEFPEKALWAKY